MTSLFTRVYHLSLQFFFKLLYNKFAWSYDWIASLVSLGQWKDWVLTPLPYIVGPRVLELGCGPGHLQAELQSRQFDLVVGLDASKQMLLLSLKELLYFKDNLCLINGYAQYIPFKSSTFDQVVVTFPTIFILNPLSLGEIYRILNPGGRLVVLPFAWISGSSWLERLAAFFLATSNQSPGFSSPPPEDSDLFSQFTYPMKQAGFDPDIHFVDLKSSRVVIVLAEKPDPNQND